MLSTTITHTYTVASHRAPLPASVHLLEIRRDAIAVIAPLTSDARKRFAFDTAKFIWNGEETIYFTWTSCSKPIQCSFSLRRADTIEKGDGRIEKGSPLQARKSDRR
jgi:hypothetical protein